MIELKTGVMKYRKSDGSYREFNSIIQGSTAEQIEIIEDAANTQIGRIESVLQEAKDSGEFDGPKGDKGDTGLTPSLSIGTVSTLEPGQSASATITGTPEAPKLNLNIPRGNTGTISNAYGSIIPYSETDNRTIKQVVDALPTSIPVMTGATSSADGIAGIVPAPVAGDQHKVLNGSGNWVNYIRDLDVLESLSMGRKTGTAVGQNSSATGYEVEASGDFSHAEGNSTAASGTDSHSEGWLTAARGSCSHAEGRNTTARGTNSHAEGLYTTASSNNQHVFGKYNVIDDNDTFVEIIGNGGSSGRSNARTLDWNGNEILAGDLTINSASAPAAVSKMIITPSKPLPIPEQGVTVNYNIEGITENHYLIAWRFDKFQEKDPLTTLSWSIHNGYFTISTNSTTLNETIQPIFVLPFAAAIIPPLNTND